MIGEEGYPGRRRAHPAILNGVLRGLLLLICALAFLAPAAVAQDDEIFVDPGSPSGKEYALPVESARQQAAKDAPERPSSAQPAPLFGQGVDAGSPDGEVGAASGTADAKRAGSGTGAGNDADAGTSSAQGAARTATLKAQAAAPDGGIGLAAVIGVGAGVLALGGAIGVLLRRRAARDA